jgi:hypothetical protein
MEAILYALYARGDSFARARQQLPGVFDLIDLSYSEDSYTAGQR